ncbi:hypothetical protein GYMLUDRAFT_1024574, partial [Collybiopsis luxurians FD-317 M1]
NAIATICDWLLNFQSATSQMSTTPKPMLSSMHSTFRGLQRTLQDKLKQLPADVPPELVHGLTAAHQKLSNYYYKYNQSPFYIWAACRKLKKDYTHDSDLLIYLETQKEALSEYFNEFYPPGPSKSSSIQSLAPMDNTSHWSRIINFSAYDQGSDNEEDGDELDHSAVAVERIFSGGQDTISLHHSSLKPGTIRVLMLYKYQLRLKRKALEEAVKSAMDL